MVAPQLLELLVKVRTLARQPNFALQNLADPEQGRRSRPRRGASQFTELSKDKNHAEHYGSHTCGGTGHPDEIGTRQGVAPHR